MKKLLSLLILVSSIASAQTRIVHKFVKVGVGFTYQADNGASVAPQQVTQSNVNPEGDVLRIFFNNAWYINILSQDSIVINGTGTTGTLAAKRNQLLTDVFPSLTPGGGGSGDVTVAGAQTLTNKTLSGASNTFSNISADALTTGSTNAPYLLTEKAKLAGVAPGAGVAQAQSTITGLPDSLLKKQDDLMIINVTKNGVTADGVTNQTANIQALIGSNRTLYFPLAGTGVYALTDSILIANVSNLKIIADKGVILTSTKNKIFNIAGSIANLEIAYISFVSTKVSATDDPEGLIFIANYGANDTMRNIRIHNNFFTDSLTKANAIKVISEGANSLIKNLHITNNRFVGVGRFGVETQNHNTSPIKTRYRDFEISDNYFERIGTIQSGVSVCAISLSGRSENGTVLNNTIVDMQMNTTSNVLYGIEDAGCLYADISGNKMFSVNYGFTGIIISAATSQAIIGSSFKNNIMRLAGGLDNTKVRGFDLAHMDSCEVSGNIVFSDGYGMRLDSCVSNNIHDNQFYSKANNVLYFQNGSTRNTLASNTLDNQAYGSVSDVIQYTGSATTNNYIAPGNRFVTFGGIGGTVTNSSSASNNSRMPLSGEPLRINSAAQFGYSMIVSNSFSNLEMRFEGSTITPVTSSTGAATNFNVTAPNSYFSNTLTAGTNLAVTTSAVIGTTLQTGSFRTGYAAKTANYTIGANDHTIECTTGSFTITLPTAASIAGREYIIKNTGAGTITMATTSSQTIDNTTPPTIAAGGLLIVKSTGANWIKIN